MSYAISYIIERDDLGLIKRVIARAITTLKQ